MFCRDVSTEQNVDILVRLKSNKSESKWENTMNYYDLPISYTNDFDYSLNIFFKDLYTENT